MREKRLTFKEQIFEKFWVRVAPSKIEGVGLYAVRIIPKGCYPLGIKYHRQLNIIPIKELEDDQRSTPEMLKVLQDFFKNGNNFRIDTDSADLWCWKNYVNHSYSPNLKFKKTGESGSLVAIREIQIGEELTCDYTKLGFPEAEMKEWGFL
jgi:SET domain-containing protein